MVIFKSVGRRHLLGPIRGSMPPRTQLASLGSFLDSRRLARLAASLWAIASLAGVLGVCLPHGPHVRVTAWLVLTVAAGVVSVVTLKRGVVSSMRAHFVLSLLALTAVSAAVEAAHGSPTVYAVPMLYLLVTIYTASFHPSKSFGVYLVLQAGAAAVVLIPSGEPGGIAAWATSTIVVSAVGVVVHLLRRELDLAARTDPLTGLWNRRALESLLVASLANGVRYERPLSLAVIDLDNFKDVNDQKGHHVGDQVLQQITCLWKREIRAGDMLARAGGDEFVLVLPDTDAPTASEILERLADSGVQSFSSGIATISPGACCTVDELLQLADRACYQAKQAGRGRTRIEIVS